MALKTGVRCGGRKFQRINFSFPDDSHCEDHSDDYYFFMPPNERSDDHSSHRSRWAGQERNVMKRIVMMSVLLVGLVVGMFANTGFAAR